MEEINLIELLKSLGKNNTMAIIERDMESFGALEALKMVNYLLSIEETVWLVSYEPLLSLLANLKFVGINVDDFLGKNLYIVDVFGSMKRIEHLEPGVYVIGGYLDDGVFVTKYRNLIRSFIGSLSQIPKRVWIVDYLASDVCRLFSNPLRTYKSIWALRYEVPQSDIRAILTYNPAECPELEDFIYSYSDVVVEVYTDGGKRHFIVTKGE
ncbi:hypothetical protein E3E23_06985 [Thermococcus sp. CX2]|uniref:hypothetical protein n=1 Tax=Thermococcus sp. CX2 TaxID=163006 RepID=UPI00143B0E1E|nr:hypothetical protein [Thermococcus sp. CX2]NJE85567.1 hypothetical protein [Thermococcus sp. CX2]